MSKKQEMMSSSDSKKVDDLLTKMDALLEAKNDMLTKLNKLEEIQHGIVGWSRRRCTGNLAAEVGVSTLSCVYVFVLYLFCGYKFSLLL